MYWRMITVSALCTILFFGGWNSLFPDSWTFTHYLPGIILLPFGLWVIYDGLKYETIWGRLVLPVIGTGLTIIGALLLAGAWFAPLHEANEFIQAPFWLLSKIFFFLFFYVWTRGTLPRFRYDQLMLVGILWLYNATGTFDLVEIQRALQSGALVLPAQTEMLLFLAFFVAFAIKVPLFPLHTCCGMGNSGSVGVMCSARNRLAAGGPTRWFTNRVIQSTCSSITYPEVRISHTLAAIAAAANAHNPKNMLARGIFRYTKIA